MLEEGYDLADPASPYMISIPKMRAGHLGAEFFSIWVDVTWPKQDLIHRALDLIDVTDQQVARHSDVLGLATTADDIERLHREGKIAILMGVEGGHEIEGDLRVLDIFYRLGVRYMTLTHTKNDELGDSSGDKPHWKGLSPLGRQAVARMNQLGMMVDISHVSDSTFYDALAVSKAPLHCFPLFLPRSVQRPAQYDRRYDSRPRQERRRYGHQFLFRIPQPGLPRRLREN